MKKVLITGGAGFIGSNLCRKLVKEGASIICYDNLLSGNMENIRDLLSEPNFQLIVDDVINLTDIGYVDEIYNLACPASPMVYQKDPIHTSKTCVLGILNVLEIARKYNSKVMHFSTSEVYGSPTEHPQNEKYWGYVNPIGIRACYDEGKRCAETICFDYIRQYHMNIIVIRIFNTYGPYMNPTDGRVISSFICQALKGNDLIVHGTGAQTRSFCFIDDLIDAITGLMRSGYCIICPINIGNPFEISIIELAHLIIKLTNSRSGIKKVKLPEDDPIRRKPDITLIKSILCEWTPRINIQEGLEKTIEYYKRVLFTHIDL